MQTVLFSFVLINIISTFVITFLWAQYRDRYKGIGYVAYAYGFVTLGFALIILRGSIPMWLSMDLANAITVTGLFLGLKGLETYTGRKSSQLLNILLLVIIAAIHVWFRIVKTDMITRYLIISVVSCTYFAQLAWLMLFRAPKNMRNLTKYTGFVFVSFSIVAIIKIVDFFVHGEMQVDYFKSDTLEAVLMIIYGMLVIILTFSLTLMFSNNLLYNIKTQEEKFSTTFHTAPNAIALTDFPDGKIMEVNKAFLEILGYTSEEVIGKSTNDLNVWKNEKDRSEANIEIRKNGCIEKKEYEFRKKNGEILVGLLSVRMISIGNDKCLIMSIFDVTERSSFQDVISHERNLLRTLIDHLPDPVTIKDSEGRYLLNNKSHLQVIGADSQDEVIGKTTYDYFPAEDAAIYDLDDRNVMKSGRMIIDKIECAVHEDTGFPYWHLTSKIPIKDKTGKSVQVLTISHDITERKKAEDALKETDEFNRSLLKTIPFGMDVVDETGTILFMGENFRKIFGYEATGKKCWDVYRDDKAQCKDCPLTKGISIGNTEIYESHDILGGKIFDVYHTGMMFHGKKAMLEIFHDITERKKAEGELIRSKEKAEESDRLKTAFLHNISHEIRTPMNAIVGFANLLREPGLSPEEQQSFTDIISRSSNHLLSIVNDVIEISNVEAGRLKFTVSDVDLTALLDDLLQQFRSRAAEKNLRFSLEIPDAPIPAHFRTDCTKLMQIFSNLLNNAFKFTLDGHISFGFMNKDPYLEFFVSDTGIGVDYDQQTKIFDRFYQVDNTVTRMHEGTGIGLAISKAYVELLGGKIWLKSSPGKGSTFYFTIPFLKKNSNPSQQI
ncbi:MAG: PAS domain S-box protein [Methanosarcina sp.]